MVLDILWAAFFILAFLIAIITLCSFVGCDDKKNEDITNNTEIVEEETVPTAETNQTKENYIY